MPESDVIVSIRLLFIECLLLKVRGLSNQNVNDELTGARNRQVEQIVDRKLK